MAPIAPYRAFALGFFRSSVFFFLAAGAFAEADIHTRSILVSTVFVLDVASWHLSQVILIAADSVYNRVWHDTLSNRLFYEKLFDRIRDKAHVDVPEIFKEGTVAARKDIENYLMDETVWYNWGWFKKTALGIGSFLWMWISYGIFYGIAGALGSSMR
jgi:hypothetical protein